jgi:hypothetical protein
VNKGRFAQATIVLGIVMTSLVIGCAGTKKDNAASNKPAAVTTTKPAPTTTTKPEDFAATEADFVNLKDMTPVRGFFVSNKLGHMKETLAVANAKNGGTYPVGTIIQLFPGEAMVKRAKGFSPGSNDWEFFVLGTSKDGTKIEKHGGAEIVNFTGKSCASCHAAAKPQFDFVCETTHGCAPLPLTADQIKGVQNGDPRPTSSS